MRQCSVSAASAQNVGRPAQLRSWRTLSCLQDTVWVLTDCGSGAVTGSCVYQPARQPGSQSVPAGCETFVPAGASQVMPSLPAQAAHVTFHLCVTPASGPGCISTVHIMNRFVLSELELAGVR